MERTARKLRLAQMLRLVGLALDDDDVDSARERGGVDGRERGVVVGRS